MAVFAIADLHLSASSDHPMDVFGSRWSNYTEKISKRWKAVVTEKDTVILPGDFSWGMTLEQAKADFALLESLPGQKLLSKGNHDFWWETAAKMNRFFEENGFHSIRLLYNNAYVVEDFIVCGTRGWFLEEGQQQAVGTVDYEKIVNREVLRLRLSLEEAKKLAQEQIASKEILAFLHFPPVWNSFECPEILAVLKEYGVKRCFHGHIHGNYFAPLHRVVDDLTLTMVSSDFLDFYPLPIHPERNSFLIS